MSDLTRLTLAQARDGLRRKQFSASELTQAHLEVIERARDLNAFVLETPEQARAFQLSTRFLKHRAPAETLEEYYAYALDK